MHIAYQSLTAVPSECKLNLGHRKCIIIAGPNIDVLKLLILSFVFIQIYIDTGFDGKLKHIYKSFPVVTIIYTC